MTTKGEVIVDGQNVCEIENLGISLMAVEDKIIIMFDEYKSGYECTDCKGSGKINQVCICESSGHPGFTNRFKVNPCANCGGNYENKRVVKNCDTCKGVGSILVIPQTAKSLPTTGIVVSMGPETPAMKITTAILKSKIAMQRVAGTSFYDDELKRIEEYTEELKNIPIRLGARVIFGPHVGTMIPFKGNIKLKIMRVHEPLAVLFGRDSAAKDFIDYEVENY